jgi:hypothetical protein
MSNEHGPHYGASIGRRMQIRKAARHLPCSERRRVEVSHDDMSVIEAHIRHLPVCDDREHRTAPDLERVHALQPTGRVPKLGRFVPAAGEQVSHEAAPAVLARAVPHGTGAAPCRTRSRRVPSHTRSRHVPQTSVTHPLVSKGWGAFAARASAERRSCYG